MSGPIRGRVARILNSREVVITAGSSSGVVAGMYFDVMDPKGEDIEDPDTGEVLGSIERSKVRVRVTRVEEKMSVASTFMKKRVNLGGTATVLADFGDLSRALMPPKYVTIYETLKTDEKTWEDLEEEQSYVKTGDPVVQVIDEVGLRDDPEIHLQLARNRSTPPAVLAKLAQRDDPEIHRRLVANPSTPPAVLAKLAQIESEETG